MTRSAPRARPGRRIALIGAGFMGSTHSSAYATLGDRVSITTVCDVSQERASHLAASIGTDASTNFDAAIDAADVVDICLPTEYHADAAIRALERGKDVIVEKPISLDLQAADAMIRAADCAGRNLMVGHVVRFWPGSAELHALIESGALGAVLSVSTRRLSVEPDWNDWMRDPRRSGGIAVDFLIHDLDQMNWYLGRPVRVFAAPVGGRGSEAPYLNVIVEYAGGVGLAEGGVAMPPGYPFTSATQIICADGVGESVFSAASAGAKGNFDLGSEHRAGTRVYKRDGTWSAISSSRTDPYAAELGYFVDCLERGCMPEQGTAQQGRDALAVALAVNRALESGTPELVDG